MNVRLCYYAFARPDGEILVEFFTTEKKRNEFIEVHLGISKVEEQGDHIMLDVSPGGIVQDNDDYYTYTRLNKIFENP